MRQIQARLRSRFPVSPHRRETGNRWKRNWKRLGMALAKALVPHRRLPETRMETVGGENGNGKGTNRTHVQFSTSPKVYQQEKRKLPTDDRAKSEVAVFG